MSLRNRALGRPRGEWAATTLYLRDDVVFREGTVYVAKTSFTSGATFNPANWDQVDSTLPPPHSHPFDTATGDVRYPLRTDTDPYPQYLTEPEGDVRYAPVARGTDFKSTSGAGLPAPTTRTPGDQHYDETTKQAYILTGTAAVDLNPDTRAWTSTDDFVAAHSHGTLHKITEGPGVPSITGRVLGDLHNDLTEKTLKILTDRLEPSVTDAFSTDGALNGRVTETGGKTWQVAGLSPPQVSGGVIAHNTSDAYYGFSLSVGDQDVEWSYQFPGSGGNNWMPYVQLRSDAVGGGQGYQIQWSGGTLTIKKNDGVTTTTLLSEATVMSSSSNDAAKHLVRARFVSADKRIEVYYDGVLRHTVVDPGTPPAGGFFYIQGRDVKHDDFRASASANTRWATTDVLPSRQTRTFTTASLAAGATEAGLVTLAPGYRLLDIDASVACRVRLYTSVNRRDADATRAVTTDPPKGSGVMLDYSVTNPGGVDEGLSPLVDGYVADGTSAVAYLITNDTAAATTVTVTLIWIRTE